MNHFEQTVGALAFRHGPNSPFNSRWAVLHFLFFVCGNGYRWFDGRLWETHGKGIYKRVDHITSVAVMPEFTQEEPFNLNVTKLYPLGTGSPILEVPKDVAPEWLDGAREAVDLAIKYCPVDMQDNDVIVSLAALRKKFSKSEVTT